MFVIKSSKGVIAMKGINTYTEFSFSEFSKLKYKDSMKTVFELDKKYGDGTITLYEIIDGINLMFCDYRYDKIINDTDERFLSQTIIMYQVIEGKVVLNLKNKKPTLLEKGDIVLYSGNGEYYDSISYNPNIKTLGLFCYKRDLIESLHNLRLNTCNFEDFCSCVDKCEYLYVVKNDFKFTQIIKELLLLMEKEDLNMIKIKSLELLCYGISLESEFHKKQCKYKKSYIEKICQVRDFIDSNICGDNSIKYLSKKFAVNTTYLKTIFKDVFDQSIHSYVIDKRLEYSKVLLQQDNLAITEIAYKIGYSSSSKFSLAFKRKFGYLPSEYRKNSISND